MIATTRAQRRALKRANAKTPDRLDEVPRDQWPARSITEQLRVWRSARYLVQEFPAPDPAIVRLSISTTELDGGRWVDGISWDELQRIKNEVGYGLHDAVEVYPSEMDIVNVANMRHLWIMRDPLSYAWRQGRRSRP